MKKYFVVFCVFAFLGLMGGVFERPAESASGIGDETVHEQEQAAGEEALQPEQAAEASPPDESDATKSLGAAGGDGSGTFVPAGNDKQDRQEHLNNVESGKSGADSSEKPETSEPADVVVRGTVEKGDTVGKILEKNSEQGTQPYIHAARQIFSPRSFRAGQPYMIVTDSATGRLKRFEYEIDARRRLVVEGIENPVARLEAIEYVTTLDVVEAVINDNMFQAVADIGESPQLALRLADLFGAEINFLRDLQEGDSFAVLIEKRQREGNPAGYGRILAARFSNKGKIFEAFLFQDGEQRPQHYNRKGENLRKTLLQAPLAFTRVTSRFSMNRLHPVLGVRRAHPGVDYGAPTGTPVKAVGDGIVTGKGWVGGYGNQIVLRHSAGLESLYSHLSGYARGMSVGNRVRQGQVIGFVGSTGLASGPHLDFRLRQNGRFINPLKAVNPRGEPVSAKHREIFEKISAEELALLNGTKTLDNYTTKSLVPEHIVLDTARSDRVEKEKAPSKTASGKKKRRRRE
ncbi:MAG: peptidoglycan DD-metalloendopeptidase family protein [Desulfovibrio sp.]|jgi:murein DD-endopeptidase MepM/ murein hydrolase activator NlpD|nr:peptidoglycan DD-metalloendopeptidase family protein [Desulfovibrio sp.]